MKKEHQKVWKPLLGQLLFESNRRFHLAQASKKPYSWTFRPTKAWNYEQVWKWLDKNPIQSADCSKFVESILQQSFCAHRDREVEDESLQVGLEETISDPGDQLLVTLMKRSPTINSWGPEDTITKAETISSGKMVPVGDQVAVIEGMEQVSLLGSRASRESDELLLDSTIGALMTISLLSASSNKPQLQHEWVSLPNRTMNSKGMGGNSSLDMELNRHHSTAQPITTRTDRSTDQGEASLKEFVLYEDGGWFEGTIVNECYEGYGTRYWPNGGKYTGEWKQSKRHGKGQHRFATGGKFFVGSWVDDQQLVEITNKM